MFAVLRLPSAIFPSVGFPIIKLIADVGEEPAARMMPTMTRPLEEALLRVPGIERVVSTTSRGTAELAAHFAWGTDMPAALSRVHEELDRLHLPGAAKLQVEWMTTSAFPIEGYALTSDTHSPGELRELAEYELKPALVRIPGVAQVQIQGGRRREFQVRLDPAALQGRGLAAADAVRALRESHVELAAGLTERNHELYLAIVDGRVDGLENLERISVPVAEGPPAALRDLGEVRVADQVSYVRTTVDSNEAVLVNLVRQPTANTLEIAREVDARLRQIGHILPRDVRFSTVYDQARFIADSMRGTRDAMLLGVALAGVVLFAFLRSRRLTLVAMAAIPVTIAITGLALSLAGETLNLMTLAGVAAALGLVADDAIVVVEELAHTGSLRGLLPALAGSSLATTVILVPFARLPSVVGAFFRPLALTLALALAVSFAVASVALPLALELTGARAKPPNAEPGRLERASRALAKLAVRRGGAAVVVLLLLMAAGAGLYTAIGSDFLPEMDEGAIVLDYWTPPGTSLTDTHLMLKEVEKQILELADVATCSRRTGTQLGFFITEPNRGDFVIQLKPRSMRRPAAEVIDELRGRIAAAQPALHTDFGQVLEDQIGDLTGGVAQPIDVKLFGNDRAALEAGARRIAQILSTVRGVDDVFDGIVVAGPALEIKVAAEAAARHGLTASDIHAEVEPAIACTLVDPVRIGDRLYDLRVLLAGGPPELENLPIRARGALLRLGDVASVSTGAPETEIQREDLATFVGVTARLTGRDLGSAMSEIRGRLERELPLGPGMFVSYGGQYEQKVQSFRGLARVLLAGLLFVGLLVWFEFGDWRPALVAVACALGALAGSLAALLVARQTLNVSSYVGAIMVVGIAGENAIFVIHEAQRSRARGLAAVDAWLAAAQRRLRPVAMTSLATIFALAPLAFAIGDGAQLMQPLAIAVMGGFALVAPLVLWVLPGACRWLER